MALRDQPYIPLYVQDFMTDEKLIECSASSVGVYIYLMCSMHKSQQYGTILLKQKDKQDSSNIKNFAWKLLKQLPFTLEVIKDALIELIEEEVLTLEGDILSQRRMVKDGELSLVRASAGKKGGQQTQSKINEAMFAQAKVEANTQANTQANSEDEYEVEYEYETDTKIPTKRQEKPPEESIFNLPTTAGDYYGVPRSQLDTLSKLYPLVDINTEIFKMIAWLNKNPKKGKTKRGMNTFINNWLGRVQDRGEPQIEQQKNDNRRLVDFDA